MANAPPPPSGPSLPPGGLPPPGVPSGLPRGVPVGGPGRMPPGMPGGGPAPGAGGPPAGMPMIGGMPPAGMKMMRARTMDGRPYIRRALKLLGRNRPLAAASLLLSLAITSLPFVVSAAFGPLIQLLGVAAADGRWDQIWGSRGPLYGKADPATGGIGGWLATPIPFAAIFAIWAGALVLAHVLGFLRAWVNARLEQRLLAGIRQDVHDHMQSLSLDFFAGGQTGALMQRVLSEAASVQRLITQVLLTPLIDVIVLILALLYLLGLSWQMTLVAFVLAPFAVLMFRFTGGKLQQAALKMAMSSRELTSELQETISGIADIQVFNAQRRRSARFREDSEAAARNSANMVAWINVSNGGSQILIAVSTALVLLIGIAYGPSFGLTLAGIIVFVQFVPNMFGPVQRLIMSYTEYNSLVPNVVATYQLLDTKPTVAEKPGAAALGRVHGNVRFEDVAFGYSPTQNVLDGLSFEVREGETVAIVGPIGSGKSTIFNLLLRFLEPKRGRITLDGHDLADVTLASLREQVSKLSQFPFFLKDTIRENVRLGRPEATDAEVEAACRLAHIHDVIVDPGRVPKGYDTIVDVQVPSGGQKRLIALARCLLREPEVLLFDEPTENLDPDQRTRLANVIRTYARERTCLVISHDMDFIAAVADRILVLNDGRVAEQGSHEELLARGGVYKTIYEMQNVDPALRRTRAGADAVGAVAGPVPAGMAMAPASMGSRPAGAGMGPPGAGPPGIGGPPDIGPPPHMPGTGPPPRHG